MEKQDQGHCQQELDTQLRKFENLSHTMKWIYFCADISVLLACISLIVFLLYKRKVRWFETKLLLCMLLYYPAAAINDLDPHPLAQHMAFSTFTLGSFEIMFPKLYYWIFFSQYLKACSLLPSFIKRTLQLKSIKEEKSEQLSPRNQASFLDKQFEFEYEIKLEHKRIKKVRSRYTVIDSLMGLWIIVATVCYANLVNHGHQPPSIIKNDGIVRLIVDISVSMILAISALFLAVTIKTMTDKRPNTCLYLWHILSFLVTSAALIVAFVYSRKYTKAYKKDHQTACEQLSLVQHGFKYLLADLGRKVVRIYFDMFILWMVYRFSDPSHIETKLVPRIIVSASEEQSSLIAGSVNTSIVGQNNKMQQRQEFFQYVLKQMSQNILTESAIGNEFVNPQGRGTFTQSIVGIDREQDKE